jgi:excisionase family DNA binding protein
MLGVREVAAALSVSTATVYKLVAGGDLVHARVLGAIRVHPADLDAFLQDRRSR